MKLTIHNAIESLPPIGLRELNRMAALQTRRDRKYLVAESELVEIMAALPEGTRSLETIGGRWSLYESTYYDTPTLTSFHLAARKRPKRFKVRTRHYVDSGLAVVEVKTKDGRGRTVKTRGPLSEDAPVADIQIFAGQRSATHPFAHSLEPTLVNRYARATLVMPDARARVTIDADYEAATLDGRRTSLPGLYIIETKTAGRPSAMDTLLWARGLRPVRFSKYSTAMAAMHPDLPANRWNRTVRRLRPTGQRISDDSHDSPLSLALHAPAPLSAHLGGLHGALPA